MNKQKPNQKKHSNIFAFSPPINLYEERNGLSAVTSFETTKSVFDITDENTSFSSGKVRKWRIPNYLPKEILINCKN